MIQLSFSLNIWCIVYITIKIYIGQLTSSKFSLQIDYNTNVIPMSKQIAQVNQQNIYMPKAHTYYPIETKRNVPESRQQKYSNPTFRVEKIKEREVDALRRLNEEMREREEIYIDKLMKLEEGLENQHREFIKLQELYTQLFQSYKQKEIEIAELETKFRESDRYKENSERSYDFKDKHNQQQALSQYSFREKEWSSKQIEWTQKEREWQNRQKDWRNKQHQLSNHIDMMNEKMMNSNENYERLVQELTYLKNKDKINHSRAYITDKTIDEMQEWQKQLDLEKENRLKYQYQNEFLKQRNNDLESQRQQFQRLLTYKQKEIIKLREQKIKIHRQSSEKFMQKSPAKLNQSRPALNPIPIAVNQPFYLQQKQEHNSSIDSNKQYFSFSRQRNNESLESELPNFPPELEIDAIINQHKK